jgi:hypothetical protein
MATKPNRESPTSPAARERHAETTRSRIKTALLIEKVQNHALGKRGSDLTPTQLAAAQTLLKKVLPDMVSTRLDGPGTPVIFHISTVPAKGG